MKQIVLIAIRELRSRSRRVLTYWMRTSLAAAAVLLVVTIILNWDTSGSQPADLAFRYLGWVGFILAAASAFATMDIICSERREGTLGLLFLTHLSGPSVVLGKFAAAAFVGVLVIAGFSPVLLVTLLPGGVTGFEVVRVVLALMLTLFFGLSLGLFVSARARDVLAATCWTILWMVIPMVMLPIVGTHWLLEPVRFLALLSPVGTFVTATDSFYQRFPSPYWISALLVLVEANVLLWLAGRTLTRNWREGFRESKPVLQPEVLTEAPLHRPAAPLAEGNPIPWLMHRQRRQPALFWIAAVLMSFVGSFGLFYHFTASMVGRTQGTSSLLSTFLWAFAEAGSAVAIAMFALAAGRFFMDARRNGTLELLLTTPIGARDLVRGQKQALLRLLAGPLVVILLPAAATLLIVLCFQAAMSDQLAPWYAANLVLYAIKQTLNVLTACTVGLWFGLHCRNSWTLMAWAAGLTAGVQWLATAALYTVYLLIRPGMSLGTTEIPLLWRFWEVVSPAAQLVPAIVLIFWANYRIRQDLAGIAEVASPWHDLQNWLREEWDRLWLVAGRTRRFTPSSP